MMSGKLIIASILFFLQLSFCWAQQSEIGCTVLRRNGVYLTLEPAHFDLEVIPQVGDKVDLFLLVKADLPPGKKEGYYELFTMEVTKISVENKSISFKCDEDLEAARTKTGIANLNLNAESRVKISW